MTGIPGGIIAGCFALAAFAVALMAGLAAMNPAATVLWRAVLVLVICYPIGLLVDALCRRIIAGAAAERERAARAEIEAPPDAGTERADVPTNDSVNEATGLREAVAAS